MHDYIVCVTIGAHTYEITKLPARRGFRLGTQIVKVLGPVIAKLENPSEAIELIADRVNEDQMAEWCEIFAEQTAVILANGNKQSLKGLFDVHFRGNYGELLEWLWASIEANYASFLAELRREPEDKESDGESPVAKTSLVSISPNT